jgi:hypothetical protein
VNEMIETAFALEDRVGVRLGPVVVNGVDLGVELPDDDTLGECLASVDAETARVLTEAATFRRSRRLMEVQEMARLAEQLPLERIVLPARLVAGLDPDDIEALATVIAGPAPGGAS